MIDNTPPERTAATTNATTKTMRPPGTASDAASNSDQENTNASISPARGKLADRVGKVEQADAP